MRHGIRAVAAVAILATSGIVVASSPASAADAQVLACSISVTEPQKLGSSTIRVTGNRTVDCGTGTSTLILQKQRFPGWWDNVASRSLSGGGFGSLDYNCNGTGTQTYRGQQTARLNDGTTKVKNSASVRISCSG